jgi:hypothetical protein
MRRACGWAMVRALGGPHRRRRRPWPPRWQTHLGPPTPPCNASSPQSADPAIRHCPLCPTVGVINHPHIGMSGCTGGLWISCWHSTFPRPDRNRACPG